MCEFLGFRAPKPSYKRNPIGCYSRLLKSCAFTSRVSSYQALSKHHSEIKIEKNQKLIQKLLHPELSSCWNKSFKWVLGVMIRKFKRNGSYIEEVCGFIVALDNDINYHKL